MSPKLATVLERRSVGDWSAAITTAWQKSVMAIFEAGDLLIEARNQLLASEFKLLCKDQLPFSYGTAVKLMRIAGNPILSKKSHVKQLPASWGTLYELTTLPTPKLEEALEKGVITPRTERKEIEALKPHVEHAAVAEEKDQSPPPPKEKTEEEHRDPTPTADKEKKEEQILRWIFILNERRQLELIYRILVLAYQKLNQRAQDRWRNKIMTVFEPQAA